MKIRAAFISILLITSGCYSYQLVKPTQPPIAALAGPPEGLGQICVLRPHWNAFAVTFAVRDNGKLVGATRGPTYFCYFAEPGAHKITSEAPDSTEEALLTVAGGGNYFLHQIVDNIFGFVRSRLAWVDSVEGGKLVERCGYRIVVGVPGKETLPGTPPIARAIAGDTAALK